jgi:hypothetical protein
MRRVRPSLEKEHSRILKLDPKQLFDQTAIRSRARSGDMAFDVTDPVLLTIVSRSGVDRDEESEPYTYAICQGPVEAWGVLQSGGPGGAGTMFELAGIAHQFVTAIDRTEPLRRGRS